jgi:hypothetical protein
MRSLHKIDVKVGSKSGNGKRLVVIEPMPA